MPQRVKDKNDEFSSHKIHQRSNQLWHSIKKNTCYKYMEIYLHESFIVL